MRISRGSLKSLISGYLSENVDREITLKFANFSLNVIKKEDGVFLTNWPEKAKIGGKSIKVSKDSPLSIEKIKSSYPDVYKAINNELSSKISQEKAGRSDRKYKYEKGVGYPIILVNTDSKPISSVFFESESNSELKKKVEDMIPEGHITSLYVEPRSRKLKIINFGVYPASEGGHAECEQKNRNIFEEGLEAVLGAAGFFAIGSLTYEDAGYGEVKLKKVKNADNTYYTFENPDKDVQDILDKVGAGRFIEHVVIDDCKYIPKSIAYVKSNPCNDYNVVPESILGSAVNSLKSMFSFFSDDATTQSGINPDDSDNCATMAYRLAHMAKKGKFPSGLDDELFQFPPKTIKYASSTLS